MGARIFSGFPLLAEPSFVSFYSGPITHARFAAARRKPATEAVGSITPLFKY